MIRADKLDERMPDVLGEIIAWRAWQIVGTEQTPRLASVTALTTWTRADSGVDAIWPTRRYFLARCPRGHIENLPIESCSCGLYAAKTREHLMDLGYGAYGSMTDKVIGEVALSGKVIEGSQGWRAERGRVHRLWVPHEVGPVVVQRLADAYRVPVEPAQWLDGKFRTLDELAEQFLPDDDEGDE